MYNGSLGTVSNRETWEQAIDVVDDSGDDVTITGATITLAVRKQNSTSIALQATNSDGITIATPRFTFRFEASEMAALAAGTYDVGVTILLNGDTTQLIVGIVTIVDGVVNA